MVYRKYSDKPSLRISFGRDLFNSDLAAYIAGAASITMSADMPTMGAGTPAPGLPKGSPVEVIYSFDTSGRVSVRAEDKTGGRAASIRIERGGGLDDERVDAYRKLARDYKVE